MCGLSADPRLPPHRAGPVSSNIALTALKFLLLGALALFFQVIANNKFLGYLLIVLFLVSRIALKQLDFDHHLYDFGSAPETPYSDMNGYGHFLAGHLWFQAYWACLAVTCWCSRRCTGRAARRKAGASARASPVSASARRPRIALALSAGRFLRLGAWIFYNTNVINRYVPDDLAKERKADYEKHYRQYKDLPQPRITDVKIDIDIYPPARHVDVRGHYTSGEREAALRSEICTCVLPIDMELLSAQFAPHDVVSDDRVHGYTIYRLAAAAAPGASMDFDFMLHYLEPRLSQHARRYARRRQWHVHRQPSRSRISATTRRVSSMIATIAADMDWGRCRAWRKSTTRPHARTA